MSGATATTILPQAERLRLAADPGFGAGNFLHRAVAANPNRDRPLVFLERPFRALSGEVYEALSLSDLKRVVDQYAAFYHGQGVRPQDLVAVFVDEGVESHLHLMALTGLGAIAVLINGNQRPEIAALYMRRVGAVGAFCEASRGAAVRPHFDRDDLARLRFVATPEGAAGAPRDELPARYPYEHDGDDVCYLCHSSGTTGLPKAVMQSHAQHAVGTRKRLGAPDFHEAERVLSALPQTHAVGVHHFAFSVASGTPLLVMSDPGAEAVLRGVESFRPTFVLAFSRTYAELAAADLAARDLGSVERWFNTADTAHEKHVRAVVRQGSHLEGGVRVPGSTFVDALGSTEMALPVFVKTHTKDSDAYGRSIGRPNPIVEVAVLDEAGAPLGPNEIGRLGVKSPATTAGYWNDSLATCRRRLKGYWLMDDYGYRTTDGVFFHVDRPGDEIKTRLGNVYTLPTEEVIMQSHDEVLDAFVVGMQVDEEYAEPAAVAYVRPDSSLGEDALLALFNARLRERDMAPLARVVVARSPGEWPVGPTGKVLKRRLRERFDQRRAPAPGGE
jgi:acyl-coenzyme A synthetase/AMP-(fatty) acid ligase